VGGGLSMRLAAPFCALGEMYEATEGRSVLTVLSGPRARCTRWPSTSRARQPGHQDGASQSGSLDDLVEIVSAFAGGALELTVSPASSFGRRS
jgi:hypothetical protein